MHAACGLWRRGPLAPTLKGRGGGARPKHTYGRTLSTVHGVMSHPLIKALARATPESKGTLAEPGLSQRNQGYSDDQHHHISQGVTFFWSCDQAGT
eukprot:1935031-Prymnesium_polylepis.1